MKRLLLLPFLLALIVIAAAPSAQADPLTLVSFGSNTFAGNRAGPFEGALSGSPITMVCLSFDRYIQVGQTWNVSINSLDALGVANALYGSQSDALLKYQRAAWLYDKILATPSEAGAIQGAIWNIFTASTPDTAASNRWFSMALNANLVGYDFSRFRILTPDNRGRYGAQEMMTTVPEPTTMLLLGSGLLGAAASARRRRRHAAANDKGHIEA